MSFNEVLSIGSFLLTVALLVRGTGVWQGKQEESAASLVARLKSLEEGHVTRREFDGWMDRVERLENHTFRRGQE